MSKRKEGHTNDQICGNQKKCGKFRKNQKNTYGICACTVDAGEIEIINGAYNISNDVVWLKALAKKLNQYDVNPIHLYDIIEDELYNIGA